MLGVPSCHSLLIALRLNWKLAVLARLAFQQASQDLLVSTSAMQPCLAFNLSAGDLNSGPYTTDPSPQS